MDLPDDTLIRQALAGDDRAFNELARRVRPALLRVAASRLGRRDLAEDAVQETLLAAYRFRHSYDQRFRFRTWLWTILLRECQRVQTKLARRQPPAFLPPIADNRCSSFTGDRVASDPGGLENLLAREQRDRLEDLLRRLSIQQADALRLRFFAGLKFQEIADTMHCSLATAKNRVRTGLLRLSAWLSSSEFDSEPSQADQQRPIPDESHSAPSEGEHAL
jgi:RNA polymerase sigma-70 factor (ECF subfamily)